MSPSRLAFALLVLVLPAFAGCPCRNYGDRKYAAPTADQLLDHIAKKNAAAHSFKTETTMDYWIGKDRFRGTVLIMGEQGAKVRMNALRPDEAVAADLACDGVNFVFVDQMNNCVLTGPCNETSIAQLLRVPLSPDDFLYLALGSTPVIPGASGAVRWDSKNGREILELTGDGGVSQTIVIDGRDGKQTWDVLESTVKGADGKVIWSATHKDYGVEQDVAGAEVRVPDKSKFVTPAEKSDLLVEDWGKREINLELAPEAFVLEPPPVPMCGQKR